MFRRYTLTVILAVVSAASAVRADSPTPRLLSHFDLSAAVAVQGWGTQLVRPGWVASPLFGCTTTTEGIFHSECEPYEWITCKKTVCRLPVLSSGTVDWVENTTFSDGCFFCIEHPECCGIGDLPGDPPVYEDIELSSATRTPQQIQVDISHLLATEWSTLDAPASASVERTVPLRFVRLPGTGSEPLSLTVDIQDFAAGTLFETTNAGIARFSFVVESPQLGTIFELSGEMSPQGPVVSGDFAPEQFSTAGGLMTLPPRFETRSRPTAGFDTIDVLVHYGLDIEIDRDCNGNGVGDTTDIALGLSEDTNGDRIPDECQTFGVLTDAFGDAGLSLTPSASMQVSNIGPSGLDGVTIDYDSLRSMRLEFGEQQLDAYSVDVAAVADPAITLASLDVASDGFGAVELTPVAVDGLDFLIWRDGFRLDVDFESLLIESSSGDDSPFPSIVAVQRVAPAGGAPTHLGFRLVWDSPVHFSDVTGLGSEVSFSELRLVAPVPGLSPDLSASIFARGAPESFLTIDDIVLVEAEPCVVAFVSGDHDGDGTIGIGDALSMLAYLFQGGAAPQPSLEAGDADGDGSIQIGDALRVLQYLFAGGASPAAPFPTAGCR